MNNKVAIIGAGPAGIAAALQLKRYGIDFVLFEKDCIGGLLHNANLVENYLGFPKGVTGEKLVDLFEKQISNLNIEPIYSEVNSIEFLDDFFQIETDLSEYSAEILVLATGTIPKKPKEFPDELSQKIFYEVKDLKEVSCKEIAIIGVGDAAFDYAMNLSVENDVTIFNRSDRIKALQVLVDRVLNHDKITYLMNSKITSISLKNDKLLLTCSSEKSTFEKSVDYLLFAVGRKPNNEMLSDTVVDNYRQLIDENKLFPVGDIKNDNMRQTSISTGDGIKAAMEIFELLTK